MAAKTKNQATAAETNGNGNKPVMTFRAKGVKICIWENVAATGDGDRKFYKSVLQCIYKEESGEFKTTNALSRDHLPVARHLLQKAWEWILEAEMSKGADDQNQ